MTDNGVELTALSSQQVKKRFSSSERGLISSISDIFMQKPIIQIQWRKWTLLEIPLDGCIVHLNFSQTIDNLTDELETLFIIIVVIVVTSFRSLNFFKPHYHSY